jgi:hypothetical protein
MSLPATNILRALDDPRLFGGVLRDKTTWFAWRCFLAALFGLGMTDAEADLYRACTGRTELPTAAFVEAWLVCGRRAGKSFVMALVAVFLACFRDYRPFLGPGERATVMVVAADRKQARTVMRYVRGLLEIPALAKLVENLTSESIDLVRRVTIEVGTASHKSLRGYSIAAMLADELAFWSQEDSASPDEEVLAAVRPAMATIPGAMLLCASSPYARRGALWEAFRRHYGQDDPAVLVWKAATRQMNPSVSERFIAEAMERDPAHATAEYLAEFRTDIQAFVSREAIESCISRDVTVRPPVAGVSYRAFVDPSGGSNDSMTLAIAHRERDVIVIDCVGERKSPISPDSVVNEFVAMLKAYRVSRITGDRFGGEWPRESFRAHGVVYEIAEKTRSDLYLAFLPVLNSGRLELLDVPRATAQFVGLERRTARSGRDSIDHSPGAHDDLANSIAGAVSLLAQNDNMPIYTPAMVEELRVLLARQPSRYPVEVCGRQLGSF